MMYAVFLLDHLDHMTLLCKGTTLRVCVCMCVCVCKADKLTKAADSSFVPYGSVVFVLIAFVNITIGDTVW